jgi:hypothetical protein
LAGRFFPGNRERYRFTAEIERKAAINIEEKK